MRQAEIREAVASANPITDDLAEGLRLQNGETALLEEITNSDRHRDDARASAEHRASPARRLAPLVAVLLLLAVSAVATPPGKAVTRWVGEQIGIGDPGGEPSLRQLRAFANQDYASNRSRVLAVGPAPKAVGRADHGRYEFIVTWPKGAHAPEGPCFELDLTQLRSLATDGCGVLPGKLDLYFLGPGGSADPDVNAIWLTGRTSTRVRSVQAEVGGRDVPVEIKTIPRVLTRHFHLPPFRFFIGFAPFPRQSTRAVVTVRGAEGRVIERQTAGHVTGSVPLYISNCAALLSQDPDPNRFAKQDCERVLGGGWRERAMSSPFYRP